MYEQGEKLIILRGKFSVSMQHDAGNFSHSLSGNFQCKFQCCLGDAVSAHLKEGSITKDVWRAITFCSAGQTQEKDKLSQEAGGERNEAATIVAFVKYSIKTKQNTTEWLNNKSMQETQQYLINVRKLHSFRAFYQWYSLKRLERVIGPSLKCSETTNNWYLKIM